MVKHLVDIPGELFRIFGEKYGAKPSEEKVIDRTKYLIRPLTIDTNAWHSYLPWRNEGRSVVTVGFYCNGGARGGQFEVARFLVWNHIPEVPGVECMSIWAGTAGSGVSIKERVVVRLGSSSEPFDPLAPETGLIIEVMEAVHRLGKDIEPRVYVWREEKKCYLPNEEVRFA